MKIAFYIPHFNNIGGIESWIYYVSKLYGKNRDISVYFVDGDEKTYTMYLATAFEKVKIDGHRFGREIKES